MWMMLALSWSSLLVLSCTAAALGQMTDVYCHEKHRLSTSWNFKCGNCYKGFHEDESGSCIKNEMDYKEHSIVGCPLDVICFDEKRLPCSRSTHGQCGDCIPGFMDIERICVTSGEVEELIKRIEDSLDEELGANNNNIQDVPLPPASPPPTQDFSDKNAEVNVQQTDQETDVVTPGATVPEMTSPRVDALMEAAAKRIPVPAPVINNPHIDDDDNNVDDVHKEKKKFSQLVFFVVVLSVSLVCVTTLIVAGVIWYRVYRRHKSSESSEYNGYNGEYTGKAGGVPKSDSGDRRLAHSAQMYHYQHHKQQIIALEKSLSDRLEDSADEGEAEENEHGDYTVYECPGLAPAGEMEVQNPLFVASKASSSTSTSPEAMSPAAPAMSPGNTSSTSENDTTEATQE